MAERRRAPTIKDIADGLGMSHSTVSRALNGRGNIGAGTVEAVRAAAARLGYVANASARSIRGGGEVWLGLIVPDIGQDFYASVAAKFTTRCRDAQARMLLAVSDDDPLIERAEIRAMRESRVSGIVASLSPSPLAETAAMLDAIPSVQLVRRHPGISSPVARLTDEEGCAAAVGHLLRLGHRRIAYVGTDQSTSSGFDRVQGFLAAHRRHGVEPPDDALELVPPTQEQGFAGVDRLLALPTPPTALILGTTRLALGGLAALQAAGLRVPDDVSVIAYGDEPWFALHSPPLTAVGLPIERLIDDAVDMLLEQVGGRDRAGLSSAPAATHLVERASTAPPRGARRPPDPT